MIFNPWIKNFASNVVLIFKVTEIIEEPKIEIVMKPVCVPIAIEDCTEEVRIGFSSFNLLKSWKVEECESVPVEKCVDVRVSAQDQVQWIWCRWCLDELFAGFTRSSNRMSSSIQREV